MSLRAGQLLRAMASSPARLRTVLKAGHSNTAVSVNTAAYFRGSRLRYASVRRTFSVSIPAFASADAVSGEWEQAPRTISAMMAAPVDWLITEYYEYWERRRSAPSLPPPT